MPEAYRRGSDLWLVERYPITYVLSQSLVHNLCVSTEVLNKFVPIEESAIAVIQRLGQIPVEESYDRFDVVPSQFRNQVW